MYVHRGNRHSHCEVVANRLGYVCVGSATYQFPGGHDHDPGGNTDQEK